MTEIHNLALAAANRRQVYNADVKRTPTRLKQHCRELKTFLKSKISHVNRPLQLFVNKFKLNFSERSTHREYTKHTVFPDQLPESSLMISSTSKVAIIGLLLVYWNSKCNSVAQNHGKKF